MLKAMNNHDLKRHPVVQTYSTADGGAVLVHPDLGLELIINPVARIIWDDLYLNRTVEQLVQTVRETTDGGDYDTINSDVSDFLKELSAAQMLIRGDSEHPRYGSMNAEPLTSGEWNSAPQFLDLSLTHHCNLNCPYCFYDDEMAVTRDLTTEEWLQVFTGLHNLPVRELVLSGGEVFTRKDLPILLEAICNAGKRFSILTNGTLVDDDWIEVLKRYRTRLSYIQFSVDGSCADVHDSIRGDGSFERTIAGLRRVLDAGLPEMVRMTINRLNASDIEAAMDFLLNDIGVRQVGTNDVVTIGAGCRINIGLSPDQHLEAMRSLVRMSRKYPDRLQASAGPLARYRSYREIDRIIAGEMVRNEHRMGRLTGCGCMGMKLAVRHDGAVSPCNMLTDLHLGNILTDSLAEIWRSHPILEAMRERSKIRLRDIEECSDCPYADYCTGNCPATRYAETGNLNLPNVSDCYRQFLRECGGVKPWNESL